LTSKAQPFLSLRLIRLLSRVDGKKSKDGMDAMAQHRAAMGSRNPCNSEGTGDSVDQSAFPSSPS
jgi:hypothetical protein